MLMFVLLLLPLCSSALTELGTFQQGENITIRQLCSDCTFNNITSIIYPNGTEALGQTTMAKDGIEYTRLFNTSHTRGIYHTNGFGDPGGVDTVWAYTFEVTPNGLETSEGIPNLLGLIIIVLFGISFFLLLLAIKIQEPGPKIFFLLTSFLFIFFTIMMAVNVAQDSNVSDGVNATLSALSFATGMILFVVFAWIFIKQTVNAINMLKIKKGLAWDGSGDVSSRNIRIPGLGMDPFGK